MLLVSNLADDPDQNLADALRLKYDEAYRRYTENPTDETAPSPGRHCES